MKSILKILDRHIGMELIWPFLFGVAAFTSIFFGAQNLLKLTSQVLSNGLPVITALQLVVLSLPGVIVYTLPMAALLAVIVGFSRLSNDSEIVALYACGVSLYRAIIPVLLLGIGVTCLGFVMSEYVVPRSNLLQKGIQARALKEVLDQDKPFVFIDKDTGSTIYVRGGISAKNRTMKDVIITRYSEGEPKQVIQAAMAKWEGGSIWSLSDGKMYALKTGSGSVSMVFEGLKTEKVELKKTPNQIELSRRSPEDMTFRELKKYIDDLHVGKNDLLDLKVELYNKLAIPLAALVFAMVSAPLAVRPARSGTSVGVGLSILIIFSYWFVWHFTTALASQGGIPPMVGAFSADCLGLGMAGFLLIRASK